MTSFALLASDSDLPYRIVSIICQTLFYGQPCYFPVLSVLITGPPMHSIPPRDIFMSLSHLDSCHGVSDPLSISPDAFSQGTFGRNSTNGLQSRSRKWLLAMIMTMFALSTVYWILSVVVTFLVLDHTRPTGTRGSPIWLPMFSTILLVNVSTVQNTQPHNVSHHPRASLAN